LEVFRNHHIDDILGVDGEWVPAKLLQIPRACFLAHDLMKPIEINRRFDLAVSLEVAEHLDRDSARRFIQTLVKLSSVVLFSAAIPYQGGTHHVNEQSLGDECRQLDHETLQPALKDRSWQRKGYIFSSSATKVNSLTNIGQN